MISIDHAKELLSRATVGVKNLPYKDAQQTLTDILSETLIALTVPIVVPADEDLKSAVKNIDDRCAVDPTIPSPQSVIVLPTDENEMLRVHLFIESDEAGKITRQRTLKISGGAVEMVVFGENSISVSAFVFSIPGNYLRMPNVILYWDDGTQQWLPDVVEGQSIADVEEYKALRLMEVARLPQVLSFLIQRIGVPV